MGNGYNKKLEIGRIRLNALIDWAYNEGKNDSTEKKYKQKRDERVDEILEKQNGKT